MNNQSLPTILLEWYSLTVLFANIYYDYQYFVNYGLTKLLFFGFIEVALKAAIWPYFAFLQ